MSDANLGAADEAAILHPDVEVEIAGRTITVREYSFADALKLGPCLVELMPDLDAAVGDGSDMSAVVDVLFAHAEALLHLLQVSTGEDKAWLMTLPMDAGEQLVLHWWGVNAHFFAQRLGARRLMRKTSRPSVKSISR